MKKIIISFIAGITIATSLAFTSSDFTLRPTTSQVIGSFFITNSDKDSKLEMKIWSELKFQKGYRIISTCATNDVVVIVMEK